jgi:hypothetical protein
MNQMIHIAAATQARLDTEGRAYYRRQLAAGKSRPWSDALTDAAISDALYGRLRADAAAVVEAGPGGHRGATLQSSAAGFHPHTGTSDQPLRGPAPPSGAGANRFRFDGARGRRQDVRGGVTAASVGGERRAWASSPRARRT